MSVVFWLGQSPAIKHKPYEGPYFLLKQAYINQDTQAYNDLIVKHNFDPQVLKQQNLPEGM